MQISPALDKLFKSKFKDYTPIQKKVYPIISAGNDVLIMAPTGTGKTEAAFLPLLDLLQNSNSQPISIVYITPLRSLNRDMVGRLREWASVFGLRVAVRHGDTSQKERAFQSKHPAHIFITTPEIIHRQKRLHRELPDNFLF